jgi:hypothetical protein
MPPAGPPLKAPLVRTSTPVDRTSAAELRASILQRYSQLQAQGRIAEALYSVALDLLGPALEDVTPHQRGRILRALDVPVGAAANEALLALENELATFLGDELPAGLHALGVGGRVSTGRVSRLDFE